MHTQVYTRMARRYTSFNPKKPTGVILPYEDDVEYGIVVQVPTVLVSSSNTYVKSSLKISCKGSRIMTLAHASDGADVARLLILGENARLLKKRGEHGWWRFHLGTALSEPLLISH